MACQQSSCLNFSYSPPLPYTPTTHLLLPQSAFIHFFLILRSYKHLSTKSSSPHLSLIPSLTFPFLRLSRRHLSSPCRTPPVIPLPEPLLAHPLFFIFSPKDVGAEQQGARALLNMVKHREEKEVWKWVRVCHSQTQRPGVARKCSVWKWRGVSVTAVVYVHDRFTVKTMTVGGAAAIWLSVMLNECDGADEITVVIHKSKRKCGSNTDTGFYIIGSWNALKNTWFLNNFRTMFNLTEKQSHNSIPELTVW